MADPIKWQSKIILAKMESTYGTDSSPSGAANAMLMSNVDFKPMEGQDVSRNLEKPHLGAEEDIPTGLYCSLSGSVELVGSGTAGTPPAWGPLLRACACAEVITASTSVEYAPVSDGHESVSIYFHIGPTLHIMTGARGTVSVSNNAQGIPVAKFTLMGLFTTPADAARPTPDLSAFQIPQVATNANTPTFGVGGQDMVLGDFEFNLGNKVEQRLRIGREEILIVDRSESISAKVDALPLATYNPFEIALARTRQAVVLVHGTAAGNIVSIEAPTCSLGRLTGYANSQNITEWPLALTPLPDAGDDQWTITLS